MKTDAVILINDLKKCVSELKDQEKVARAFGHADQANAFMFSYIRIETMLDNHDITRPCDIESSICSTGVIKKQ